MVIDNQPIENTNDYGQQISPKAPLETKILKEIYLKERKSVLIAPLSIDQLVGMIYPLFAYDDQGKILQGVFGTKNKEAVHSYLKSMLENHPLLKMGNCFASNIDLSFMKEHLTFLQAEELDLNDAFIIEKINAFIDNKTQGMITKLFENKRHLPSEGFVAINAGSFIGKFDDAFDPSNTKKRAFFNANKEITQIDMMWGMKKARYFEDENLQYLELPMENSSYFLQLSLPKEYNNLENLLESDPFHLGSQHGKFCWVDITLPKFTIEDTQELLEKLLKNGIPLDKKTEAGKLTSVLQKTYFVLEEKGVKAAFVTAGRFETTSVKPLTQKICFDRPFTFRLISHDRIKIMEGIFNG